MESPSTLTTTTQSVYVVSPAAAKERGRGSRVSGLANGTRRSVVNTSGITHNTQRRKLFPLTLKSYYGNFIARHGGGGRGDDFGYGENTRHSAVAERVLESLARRWSGISSRPDLQQNEPLTH